MKFIQLLSTKSEQPRVPQTIEPLDSVRSIERSPKPMKPSNGMRKGKNLNVRAEGRISFICNECLCVWTPVFANCAYRWEDISSITRDCPNGCKTEFRIFVNILDLETQIGMDALNKLQEKVENLEYEMMNRWENE